MLLALSTLALAASEPQITVLDDGRTVQGRIEVAADQQKVRSLVEDPELTAKAGGSSLTVKQIGVEGECKLLHFTVPSIFKDLTYTAKLCPTAEGAEVNLVESEDFDVYLSSFDIDPLGDGRTAVTYQVLSIPSFYVPQFLVRSQVTSEVETFMVNVGAWLER